MVCLITYDLKRPVQNYSGLYEAIKQLGPWMHYLESTWLVDTQHSPDDIIGRLKAQLDPNDSLLVIRVARDYSGWLPKDAWDWLNNRRNF